MIETRQILEELQLKNVLATSSTGAVFLAGDPESGTDVVIKMISCAVPNAEDVVRRLFLKMIEAARSKHIQAMPTLTDHGLTPEGDGFVVMDFVEGETLDSIEDLSVFAAINILLDVLSCIEGLAGVGSAHLNLKPTNIFVTNAPANDRARVLGFGTSATLLHAGAGVPVPADDPHIAPELVTGNVLPSEQAWRSDLFSLGVIACGALGAEIEADGYGRPRVSLPAAVRVTLPEADPLEDILGRIMDPDPTKRGDSPFDVRDSLIRALPDPLAVAVPVAAPDVDSPLSSYDPNKTDPAFDPAPTTAVKPEIIVAEISTESELGMAVDGAVVEEREGWPEVFFDDPELPASLDSSEDTDVHNPIPVDVWVPEVDEVDRVGSAPAAVPPPSQKATGKRRVSRVELTLVAAVVIVLGSIVAFTWPTGGDDEGLAVAMATQLEELGSNEALVPPPPDDNLFDDLLAIQQLVDVGDLAAARDSLDALDDRDGFSFSSDETALYDNLVAAVAQAADRGAAIEDLRTGLDYGSVKMLRRGVAGLAGLPQDKISEVSGLAGDLTRARRVLGFHSDMWDAHRDGDHLGAIEKSVRLENMLPGYSGAADVRDQSASALEARAEVFISDDQYENAVTVLESLRRVLPDRDGPATRIAWCQEHINLTRREESVIANALAMGDTGDPEEGLALLDRMTPDPRLRGEYDSARLALEDRIAEMDADQPAIEFATAMELGFKKNETITVPLKVTDDYRVERVVVHARNEADDGFLQIPLEADGGGLYNFVITPELHGNKDVYFFVVARDHSGNIGRFGSREEPQTVTRKKWFKKIL